jgi:hypothetical protein
MTVGEERSKDWKFKFVLVGPGEELTKHLLKGTALQTVGIDAVSLQGSVTDDKWIFGESAAAVL